MGDNSLYFGYDISSLQKMSDGKGHPAAGQNVYYSQKAADEQEAKTGKRPNNSPPPDTPAPDSDEADKLGIDEVNIQIMGEQPGTTLDRANQWQNISMMLFNVRNELYNQSLDLEAKWESPKAKDAFLRKVGETIAFTKVWEDAADDNYNALVNLSAEMTTAQKKMKTLWAEYQSEMKDVENPGFTDYLAYGMSQGQYTQEDAKKSTKEKYNKKARELASETANAYAPSITKLGGGRAQMMDPLNAIVHPGAYGGPTPPVMPGGPGAPGSQGGAPGGAPSAAPTAAAAPPTGAPRMAPPPSAGPGAPTNAPHAPGAPGDAPRMPDAAPAMNQPAPPGQSPAGPGAAPAGIPPVAPMLGSGATPRSAPGVAPSAPGGSAAGKAPATPPGAAAGSGAPPPGTLSSSSKPPPGMAPSGASSPGGSPGAPGVPGGAPQGGNAPSGMPPNGGLGGGQSGTIKPPPMTGAPNRPQQRKQGKVLGTQPDERSAEPGTPDSAPPLPPSGASATGGQAAGVAGAQSAARSTFRPETPEAFRPPRANAPPVLDNSSKASKRRKAAASAAEAASSANPQGATLPVLANQRVATNDKQAPGKSERERSTGAAPTRGGERERSPFTAGVSAGTVPVFDTAAAPDHGAPSGDVPVALRGKVPAEESKPDRHAQPQALADRTRRATTQPTRRDDQHAPVEQSTWNMENPGGPVVAGGQQSGYRPEPAPTFDSKS